MLNSYKTLINGIATAVNALKAEVKKLSGKVDNIDLPEIDGQTIIKGADGKLSTSLGAYERNIDITWDGDTTGLESFTLSYTVGGDSMRIPYYRLSDKVLTEDDIWASTMVNTSYAKDVKTDFATETWGTGILKGDGCFIVYNLIFAIWGMPAIFVVTEEHASYSYSETSDEGVKSTLSISDIPHKGTYFVRFLSADKDAIFVKELKVRRLKTIDKKFLPAAEGETMVVNISGNGTSDDPYVADMTFDNVYEGYKSKANIIALRNSSAMHLMSADEYNMKFVYLDNRLNWAPGYPTLNTFTWERSGEKLYFTQKSLLYSGCVTDDLYKSSPNENEYYSVPTVSAVKDAFKALPQITTTIDADSTDEQGASAKAVYNRFESLKTEFILNSSTSGSSKQFKITVDDSGTISATEVATS